MSKRNGHSLNHKESNKYVRSCGSSVFRTRVDDVVALGVLRTSSQHCKRAPKRPLALLGDPTKETVCSRCHHSEPIKVSVRSRQRHTKETVTSLKRPLAMNVRHHASRKQRQQQRRSCHTPCHAMSYHVMLCHAMPCRAIPCNAMLCHAMLLPWSL